MRDFSIDIIWSRIQTAITAIGGWLGYFLGGMDGLMIALIVFMVIDYITGVMCAIADKSLSSEIGAKGIAKKVAILMLVGIAHIPCGGKERTLGGEGISHDREAERKGQTGLHRGREAH